MKKLGVVFFALSLLGCIVQAEETYCEKYYWDHRYVDMLSHWPDQCEQIVGFTCPAGETAFSNQCGCGCLK